MSGYECIDRHALDQAELNDIGVGVRRCQRSPSRFTPPLIVTRAV